jgi:hypothetical protein
MMSVRPLLLSAACLSLWAGEADLELRRTPVAVDPSAEVILVSWGSVGPWIKTDPSAIHAELEDFRRFFQDEVVRQVMKHVANRGADISRDKAGRALAQNLDDWMTKPSVPSIPRQVNPGSTSLPVPEGLTKFAWPVRQTVRIHFYDDADRWQRRWLLQQAHGFQDGMNIIFAIGWKNREDLKRFIALNRGLPISALTEGMAKEFGITGLPAIIDFPTEQTMRFRQGLDAALIEADEARRRDEGRPADVVDTDQGVGKPPTVPADSR